MAKKKAPANKSAAKAAKKAKTAQKVERKEKKKTGKSKAADSDDEEEDLESILAKVCNLFTCNRGIRSLIREHGSSFRRTGKSLML